MAGIVADGFKCSGSLQTNFDLLGELMKFSREVRPRIDAVADVVELWVESLVSDSEGVKLQALRLRVEV